MAPPLDPSVIEQLRQLNQDGEPDVVTEVLELFRADVPVRLALLEAAVTGGDTESIHRTAHSLKGSAGNVGALPLQALCKELEQEAKEGRVVRAPQLVADIRAEYLRVEADIPRYLVR